MTADQQNARVSLELICERFGPGLAASIGSCRGAEFSIGSSIQDSAPVSTKVAVISAEAADIDVRLVAHLKTICEGGVMLHDVCRLSGGSGGIKNLEPQSEDDLYSSSLSESIEVVDDRTFIRCFAGGVRGKLAVVVIDVVGAVAAYAQALDAQRPEHIDERGIGSAEEKVAAAIGKNKQRFIAQPLKTGRNHWPGAGLVDRHAYR